MNSASQDGGGPDAYPNQTGHGYSVRLRAPSTCLPKFRATMMARAGRRPRTLHVPQPRVHVLVLAARGCVGDTSPAGKWLEQMQPTKYRDQRRALRRRPNVGSHSPDRRPNMVLLSDRGCQRSSSSNALEPKGPLGRHDGSRSSADFDSTSRGATRPRVGGGRRHPWTSESPGDATDRRRCCRVSSAFDVLTLKQPLRIFAGTESRAAENAYSIAGPKAAGRSRLAKQVRSGRRKVNRARRAYSFCTARTLFMWLSKVSNTAAVCEPIPLFRIRAAASWAT